MYLPISLTQIMIAVTTIGSPYSISLLCAATILFLWLHKKPHHLLQFMIFSGLGALSVWLLKNYLQLPRPGSGLIEEYGYGFPSGHSAMATLFFLLVLFSYMSHVKSAVGKLLFVIVDLSLISAIAYSRIYLGVHSWFDVIGGVSLGLFWFILSVLFFEYLQKNKPGINVNSL